MKQYFILLLLTICTSSVFAQGSVRVQQRQLDSLRLLIREHPEADTIRVQLLIDYGQLCFYDFDFLNGLKAVNEARLVAKEIDFAKGEGLYLKSMAIFSQRSFLGNVFTRTLDSYYEVQGNRFLHRYTNFDLFGNINLPYGVKDLETETIISNLQEALSYFKNQENKETIANIHYALSLVSNSSNEHKKLAQKLFHELGLSFHELTILTNDIKRFWQAGKEEEAKVLEIKAVKIYTEVSNKNLKALCASLLGATYSFFGRTNLGLEFLFEAEELLQEIGEKDLLKNIYLTIAATYEWYLSDSEKAIWYIQKEIDLRNEMGYRDGIQFSYVLYLESLLSLNRVAEFPEAYKDYLIIGPKDSMSWFHADVLWNTARMLQAQGKSKEAQLTFQESMLVFEKINDRIGGGWPAMDLAESLKNDGDLKNAIKFALISYEWLSSEGAILPMQFRLADLLSQLYEQSGQNAKAFDYLKLSRTLKDKNEKLNSAVRISELEVQSILKKRQREIELLETESRLKEQENKTQRIWIFSIAGALISVILLTFILVRNNRQKQKANSVLASTLNNLKSTQAQLIQSEKMASLGELTAGIAHEIQNPLNFVNNFSKVSTELLEEMDEELKKGNKEEIKEIMGLLSQNLEKIHHHGERASGIVKNMLQHSRSGAGKKEPTDINALADEYFSLAYHAYRNGRQGLRARAKLLPDSEAGVNVEMKTSFDENIGKINVIPQDIGRVLLNLINNAFYVVNEKAQSSDSAYVPQISISTKKRGGVIEISVQDNGNGIPVSVKEKIFQPFFTTKPTGEGTGLGLSLAYDIVTKGHGGMMEVETKEGIGSTFIIKIPVNNQYK